MKNKSTKVENKSTKVENKSVKKKNKSIKVKLSIMVSILILASIILSESYIIVNAKKAMISQMKSNGLQIAKSISLSVQNGDAVSQAVEEQLEEQIYTACQVVLNMQNPSNEALTKLAEKIGVTEIALADKNGVVLYSNFPGNLGYTYKEESKSRQLLTTDTLRINEEITLSDTDDKYYKYGSATLDHKGFVQIGIVADKVMELINENSAQAFLDKLDKTEVVYAGVFDKDLKAISHTDKSKVGEKSSDEFAAKAISEGKVNTRLDKNSYIVSMPYDGNNSEKGLITVAISVKEMNDKIQTVIGFSTIIALILIMITVAITYKLISKMINPLVKLADASEKIAGGDLTKKIIVSENNDEIGILSKSYEKMVGNLKNIINDIQYSSEEIIGSSNELAAFAEEVSATSEEISNNIQTSKQNSEIQNTEINYVKENFDDLSEKLQIMNETVNDLKNYSNVTSDLSVSGKEYLISLNKSINNIGDSSKNISGKIQKLNDKSSEISTIVQVINSIAEQTNLLALNAAIEAARVGEAGRGFAVVADEIRNLSEQSKGAARKIENIINDILNESDETVKVASESEKIIEEGIANASNTENCFNDIIKNIQFMIPHIQKTSEEIGNINKTKDGVINSIGSAVEASVAINESFNEIASVSEGQSLSTEQLANIAVNLNNLSLNLKQNTDKFKISGED